jgi:predicted O-methyltransferase YrrM
MMSVVCVFNNRELLDRFLLQSLERQSVPFDLHLVDNIGNRSFSSAAEALNHGAKNATGDYIMFIHQDVALSTRDWLESVEETLRGLPSLGVAGVAGKVKKGMHSYSNAEHAPFPKPACHNRVLEPMKAQTLDELIGIVPREVFERFPFNEDLCPDWHLYLVELCLRLKRQGLETYIIPQRAYHWAGTINYLPDSYFTSLRRVLPEYREHRHIATTSGDWSPRLPVFCQRLKVWRYIYRIRPFLRSDDKFGRICAALALTPLGWRLLKESLRENSVESIWGNARVAKHGMLQSAIRPQTQLERCELTPTEINEHLVTLRMLAREVDSKHILELGVASGQSTLAFLHAAKDTGGRVTSIDIEDCPIAETRVNNDGLSALWRFIRGDDMTVPWDEPIDTLFIDTSHAYYHTYAELEKYEPFVNDGGVIILHDIDSFPGVQTAISEYTRDRPDLRPYSFHNNNGLGVIFKKKV